MLGEGTDLVRVAHGSDLEGLPAPVPEDVHDRNVDSPRVEEGLELLAAVERLQRRDRPVRAWSAEKNRREGKAT